MAVTYKKLFHLMTDQKMTNAQLAENADISLNSITGLKRDEYVSDDILAFSVRNNGHIA